MADEHIDDDVLDLTEEQQIDDETLEETSEAPEAEAQDEFAIELEGEEPVEETPLIRQLRAEVRDAKRELAERRKADAPQVVVGERPTLEACDYDEDKFATKLEQWHERKAQAAENERKAEQAAQVRNQEFERAVSTYRSKAAALPVKDFQQAEEAVRGALPELLQSAIIQYADDPAKVVYALYKHPQKIAQLADEPDPIKAIKAVWNMERNIKVATRKPPPPPMAANIQRGSAPVAANDYDKQLEALEKKAERTGNRTEVIAFKRAHREKANG
jgi:hypothetical protein